jgi:hypothetical protein
LGKGRDQDSPGMGLKWSYESARKFDLQAGSRNFSTARLCGWAWKAELF